MTDKSKINCILHFTPGVNALKIANPFGGEAEIKQIIKDHGLSPELGEMLNSPAFYQAVIECYPDRGNAQMLFVSSLIMSDVAGKILGGVAASK